MLQEVSALFQIKTAAISYTNNYSMQSILITVWRGSLKMWLLNMIINISPRCCYKNCMITFTSTILGAYLFQISPHPHRSLWLFFFVTCSNLLIPWACTCIHRSKGNYQNSAPSSHSIIDRSLLIKKYESLKTLTEVMFNNVQKPQ